MLFRLTNLILVIKTRICNFVYIGPTEAPQNLTLEQLVSGSSAILSWKEVSSESIRGHFRGYKIQTWVKGDEENIKEIFMKSNTSKALVSKFTPDSVNYARIMAVNDRFSGPPSNTIQFETDEGVPDAVQSLQAFPMGSSAFMLFWKRPLLTNGQLQGYRIYYEKITGTELGPRYEREPGIRDPEASNAKLAGLHSWTKYRIHVVGYTKQGEGEYYYIEQTTAAAYTSVPDIPLFELDKVNFDYGSGKVRVTWRPNYAGVPGSHFYVQYRKVSEPSFVKTDFEIIEDYIEVGGLEPNEGYEFQVVSVDGNHETPSAVQVYSTFGGGLFKISGYTNITGVPQYIEAVAGTSAILPCTVVSDPATKVKWQLNGETIDFESQPRFIKSSDHSLSISSTTESDSGSYTCLARTELDEASASEILIVRDVPNAPSLTRLRCNAHDASVSWEPKGDNRSPILFYKVQYSMSIAPDNWIDAAKHVPATAFYYTVAMSPGINYTYRVIAVNKVGSSSPSKHSKPCSTQADVPF